MNSQETADRIAIAQQSYRYCRSVDRPDISPGDQVFHAHSCADFLSYKGCGRGWIDEVCRSPLNLCRA
jgi:hypothetical protein